MPGELAVRVRDRRQANAMSCARSGGRLGWPTERTVVEGLLPRHCSPKPGLRRTRQLNFRQLSFHRLNLRHLNSRDRQIHRVKHRVRCPMSHGSTGVAARTRCGERPSRWVIVHSMLFWEEVSSVGRCMSCRDVQVHSRAMFPSERPCTSFDVRCGTLRLPVAL